MSFKHPLKLGFALLSGAIVSACAPVNILNTITPSGSFERTKNVSYGPLDRQKLDVYKSDRPKSGAPMLVFVHGGSWTDGNKNMYKFLAEGFTKSGYDIAVPNYRLSPEAKYPDMIVDTAKVVAYLTRTYPDRQLVLMGHSAGAYNVLMTALEPKYLQDEAVSICKYVAGVVSLAAPTGVVPLKEEPYITIFPDRFTGSDAPLNNAQNPSPPIFFGHGLKDTTVYPKNSQVVAEKIIARGGVGQVNLYPDLGHTGMVRVLSRLFDGESDLKSDIVSFIDGLPLEGETYCQ